MAGMYGALWTPNDVAVPVGRAVTIRRPNSAAAERRKRRDRR